MASEGRLRERSRANCKWKTLSREENKAGDANRLGAVLKARTCWGPFSWDPFSWICAVAPPQTPLSPRAGKAGEVQKTCEPHVGSSEQWRRLLVRMATRMRASTFAPALCSQWGFKVS